MVQLPDEVSVCGDDGEHDNGEVHGNGCFGYEWGGRKRREEGGEKWLGLSRGSGLCLSTPLGRRGDGG